MKSTFSLSRTLAMMFCSWGLVLGTILPAQAAITVANLDDSGPGSLRQAISDAAPGDTIDFAVTGTITLTSGALIIANDLTISGPGPTNLTVSGNRASQVIYIPAGTVRLSGLTIADGNVSCRYCYGSGIVNGGSLTISNCTITNCGGGPGWTTSGGGIYNGGNLVVQDSRILNNWGDGSSGGGGILSVGSLVVVNTTISGNRAAMAGGGGINNSSGSMWITNTTISGNSAQFGGGIVFGGSTGSISCSSVVSNGAGGGIYAFNPMSIQNSIIAGNSGADYSGTFNSLDFNLIANTNGAIITGLTTHNIYGKDPLLGPLADNGGPTPTHALLPGSPAIDHGSSGGLATDQRGQSRGFNFPAYFDADDASDIGAYELQERAQTNWVVNGSSSNLVFIVNSTNDVDDGVPGIAHCSLREAINAANATPGTNTINFAAEIPGLHTGVTGTITLSNGELTITNSVNINGPGAANLTVSGNNTSRVVTTTGTGPVHLSALTIADGISPNGAGILNTTFLTISKCAIVNNNAQPGDGGGINNAAWGEGDVVVQDSLISSNSARLGGGIYSGGGSVAVIHSTISSNHGTSSGGGVFTRSVIVMTNATVSGNSISVGRETFGAGIALVGDGGRGDISSSSIVSNAVGVGIVGTLSLQNTIVAGNGSADCSSSIIDSLDYNFIQNTNGCTITNLTAHNIYNQDPKLGPLAYLGGPTPTHALRYDSPALNAGNSGGLNTDQRGFPRPLGPAAVSGGDGSDIGAYEADPILRILSIQPSGSDILVNYNTIFGRVYQVHGENSLTGFWTVLATNIAGSGGIMQCVDTNGSGQPQRFYRAMQQ